LSQTALSAREEWKRGWGLVLASCIGFSFFSVPTATLGVFMEPIGDNFGWGRTLISAGTSISSVVTALLSPFFGILIDRYGSRRLALPGLVVTSFAIASIALANGSAAQWLAIWAFYALISISVKTTVWTAAVSGTFNAGRGLALGLTLSGTAAAQIIAPPLSNWLIDAYGWRLAYVWIGLGWGSVALLLSWLFLYDAHDRRRTAARDGRIDGPAQADLAGLPITEAWRSRALWSIAVATFVMMLFSLGLQIHQVPILTGAGVSRSNAAWLAGLFGVTGIIGKLATGWLLDRFPRRHWIGAATLAANAISFALLLTGDLGPAVIVAAIAINGYSAGTKLQICTLLTSRYGGMRNFGKIYGAMTSIVALGSGLGPMVAGMVFDLTGSYAWFLLAGVIGCIGSALLILLLPAYPDWVKQAPAA
jgi:predicted MFS family arabinose efflux permease